MILEVSVFLVFLGLGVPFTACFPRTWLDLIHYLVIHFARCIVDRM